MLRSDHDLPVTKCLVHDIILHAFVFPLSHVRQQLEHLLNMSSRHVPGRVTGFMQGFQVGAPYGRITGFIQGFQVRWEHGPARSSRRKFFANISNGFSVGLVKSVSIRFCTSTLPPPTMPFSSRIAGKYSHFRRFLEIISTHSVHQPCAHKTDCKSATISLSTLLRQLIVAAFTSWSYAFSSMLVTLFLSVRFFIVSLSWYERVPFLCI